MKKALPLPNDILADAETGFGENWLLAH